MLSPLHFCFSLFLLIVCLLNLQSFQQFNPIVKFQIPPWLNYIAEILQPKNMTIRAIQWFPASSLLHKFSNQWGSGEKYLLNNGSLGHALPIDFNWVVLTSGWLRLGFVTSAANEAQKVELCYFSMVEKEFCLFFFD